MSVRHALMIARIAKPPSNVIHVGVGDAEEAVTLKTKWKQTRFIGIDPHHKAPATKYPGEFIRAAVARRPGFITFYRRPSWKRSSVFSYEKRNQSLETVYAVTLDMVANQFDVRGSVVLVLECEGSELFAMMGGEHVMNQVTWASIETEGQFEKGIAPPKSDIENFMDEHGFNFFKQSRRHSLFKRRKLVE